MKAIGNSIEYSVFQWNGDILALAEWASKVDEIFSFSYRYHNRTSTLHKGGTHCEANIGDWYLYHELTKHLFVVPNETFKHAFSVITEINQGYFGIDRGSYVQLI